MTARAAPAAPLSVEDRLDLMAAQLDAMADELRAQREAREKWQELTAELTPVARGALDVATRELQDLEPDVTTDEVARFLRTFVRTMPKLEAALVQLESALDLMSEATSLGGAGMKKLSDTMEAADQRGYFAFAAGGRRIADAVVQALPPEDMDELADRAPAVVAAVTELTRPEALAVLRRTAVGLQTVDELRGPASAARLLKELRDPQVRLGLVRAVALLRAIGSDSDSRDER